MEQNGSPLPIACASSLRTHVSVNVFTPRQEIVILGYLVKKYKGELHNIDGEGNIGLPRDTEYPRKKFMLNSFSNKFDQKKHKKMFTIPINHWKFEMYF